VNLVDAKTVASELMRKHGLVQAGWTFRFGDGLGTVARCSSGLRRITLSKHYAKLNDEKVVRDIILHEIAHALNHISNPIVETPLGPAKLHLEPHGAEWKRIARSIGCTSRTCAGDETVHPDETARPALKWVGTCPACGIIVCESDRWTDESCGTCNPKEYDARFKIVWTPNDSSVQTG
jgi:predicted SprT family Zn-dependent metalloprotease